MTRERPILFSAPMVRAILDGRKTQTRRIVKPQPIVRGSYVTDGSRLLTCGLDDIDRIYAETVPWVTSTCPHGSVGDRLWVRETWRLSQCASGSYIYAASASDYERAEKGPWRTSIHMPRWASRITLEVTDVRVERLQEISEDDARAEGVETQFRVVVMRTDGGANYSIPDSYRGGFANLWDEIYDNWDANPWVWAISFRLVQP